MLLSLRVTWHLLDCTLQWSSHRPTHCMLGASRCFAFLLQSTAVFHTKTIYRAHFQKGHLSAPLCPSCLLPWEGLGLFYFQRKGPRSHCFPPTSSLLSPSATLLQHFLYVRALLTHTHSILHTGGISHRASVGTTLQLSQPPWRLQQRCCWHKGLPLDSVTDVT